MKRCSKRIPKNCSYCSFKHFTSNLTFEMPFPSMQYENTVDMSSLLDAKLGNTGVNSQHHYIHQKRIMIFKVSLSSDQCLQECFVPKVLTQSKTQNSAKI